MNDKARPRPPAPHRRRPLWSHYLAGDSVNRNDLNDTRLFWKLSARPGGIHSHDARKLGVSGNPSQRSKDCADRVPMWKVRAPRNGRNGTRYFADGYQPHDADPVKPNRAIAPVPTGGITYRSYGPASDGQWHFNLTRAEVDAMIAAEAESLGLAA